MNNFLLYLILRSNSIKCGFVFLFWIFLIISASFAFYLYKEGVSDKEKERISKKIKNSFLASMFFLFLNIFMPSTKELLIIYGVNVIKDTKIIGITGKGLEYIDDFLDKKINELKESKGD